VCNFVVDCKNGYDESFCLPTCDFEQNNMCGWYNPYNQDALQWRRHKGETPSNGTGPTTDHTLGTGKGYSYHLFS